MALRLEIISKQRQELGARQIKEFGVSGGTIGRSVETDWVLPDPQRYLSSRHAAIDYRSGSYYVVDTSMNGVYVNDSEKAVGRGKPQRLFNGDKIRIGDFEMRVHIDDEDQSDIALTDVPHVDPVDRAQQVEPPDPTTNDLVDAYEVTGVGLEDLLSEHAEAAAFKQAAERRAAKLRLEETSDRLATARVAEKPAAAYAAKPTAAKAEAPRPAAPKAASPAPAPVPKAASAKPQSPRSEPPVAAAGASTSAADTSPLAAFFRGAGLAPQELDDKQVMLTLHLLGQIMREVIVGLRDALHLRAEQKNVLRVAHTTIEPKDNNPLKFSAGIDETLCNLLFRRADEYTPPVEAVREVFRDLCAHQHALVSGGIQALSDYMSRLEPEEIEQKFNGGAKRNALIGAANKLRYWDFYKDLYQVMAQHAPDQYPPAFLEELTRAYEQRMATVKPASRLKPSTKPSTKQRAG
jgi:type VI secretion system FHA domain protein